MDSEYVRESKKTYSPASMNSGPGEAMHFEDNRPGSVLQRQQANNLSGHNITKAPVQFQLPSGSEFISKTNKHDTDDYNDYLLFRIWKWLKAYHKIPKKHYQARLRMLRKLDRSIYFWFDENVKTTIEKTPNGPYLKALLVESETEHQNLIGEIKQNPNELPIDAKGMSGGKKEKVKELWQSILEGSGNLKMKGNAEFKDKMLASIAKLMQTRTGMKVLTGVNTNQGHKSKQVILGEDFDEQMKALGREKRTETEAVPNTREEDRSYEMKFGGSEPKRGTPAGSFVNIAKKLPMGVSIGEHLQEILQPGFVTLGHELKHSLNMLGGEITPNTGKGSDLHDYGYKGDGARAKLWTNAEEYRTISDTENRIRDEAGLSRRQFHAKGRKEVMADIREAEILSMITKMEQHHLTDTKAFNELMALNMEIKGLKTRVSNLKFSSDAINNQLQWVSEGKLKLDTDMIKIKKIDLKKLALRMDELTSEIRNLVLSKKSITIFNNAERMIEGAGSGNRSY